VGYISDTEELFKAPWLLSQHDRVAVFKLSESSLLQPPVSAKYLPGGQTQILDVRRIWRINRHPVETDDNSPPESIWDTADWLNWNGDFDNPNDSEDNWAGDVESEREQDRRIEDPECPEQWDVSAVPNVPGLIWPSWKSHQRAETVLMTVNAIEIRRNTGVKKK